MRHPCLWYLSPRAGTRYSCSPFQSCSSASNWLIALSSFTIKYKSLEKTILGQVYGKMLSFFITAHHCVYSSGGRKTQWLALSPSPSQHSEAYLPHFQKLFQQKGEGLPFSTLQNFTFRGLQLQKVVLPNMLVCWSCTNCSIPPAPLSIQ